MYLGKEQVVWEPLFEDEIFYRKKHFLCKACVSENKSLERDRLDQFHVMISNLSSMQTIDIK